MDHAAQNFAQLENCDWIEPVEWLVENPEGCPSAKAAVMVIRCYTPAEQSLS
jgi:hypothetical protein